MKRLWTIPIILILLLVLVPVETMGLDVSCRAVYARESYYSEGAWSLGYSGLGINIAILDTGVDDGHESLDGKFVAGVDLSKRNAVIEGNPDDTNGHGTHCAGIAMGTGGDSGYYMGVAPGAGLIDVKIASALGVGSTGEGIDWCVENMDRHDIRILSISYGNFGDTERDGSDSQSQRVNNAVNAGLVVVVSAGNDGPDNNGFSSLAAADLAITVAAVDDMGTVSRTDDVIADFSNRGPRADDGDDDIYDELKPDISAPGVDIMSARHSSTDQNGVGYVQRSGTSMACPHVAGICALMLEANPHLTPRQVKEILHITAEQRGNPDYPDYPYPHNKWNKSYGYGIVDAYAAVKMALDYTHSTPSPSPIALEAPAFVTPPVSSDEYGNYELKWSYVSGATGYTLMEDVQEDFSTKQTIYDGSAVSFLVENKPDGTYYYRVMAYNDETVGPTSSQIRVDVARGDAGGGGEDDSEDDGSPSSGGENETDAGGGGDDDSEDDGSPSSGGENETDAGGSSSSGGATPSDGASSGDDLDDGDAPGSGETLFVRQALQGLGDYYGALLVFVAVVLASAAVFKAARRKRRMR